MPGLEVDATLEERHSRNEEQGPVSYEMNPVVPITLKTYNTRRISWLRST